MKLNYSYLVLFLLVFGVSCGTKKKGLGNKEKERKEIISRSEPSAPPVRKTFKNKTEEYIYTYAGLAKEEMALYKIPASITLAQGILESGAGQSDLTRRANNHFGIKCHGWKGGKVYHDDDAAQECFRKYKDPKYSFRDHSLFLTERKRYAGLFKLDPGDYKGWARGLRAAGYATDRAYPSKLIDIIERYQLYRFDAEVLGKSAIVYEEPVGLAETYVVQKGDTLYSIGRRFNISVEQLKQYNNLSGNTISIGQVLYLNSLNNNL